MKQKFNASMLWLLGVLLFPLCATAQEITALGFVEDKKAYGLEDYFVRLAFVRTNAGWEPSSFFAEENSGLSLAESKNATSRIMKTSWQVVGDDGKNINAGSLSLTSSRNYAQSGLTKTSHSLDGKLKFDSPDSSIYTWKGNGRFPYIAVPSGTNVEKIEPVAMNGSVEQKIKDKLVKQYFRKKRTVCKCDSNETLISKRKAKASDVVIKPLVGYKDNISFYEVLIPDTSDCGIIDDEMELMAVKNGKVVNLTESSGMADDRPTTTAMTLFNRYVISTKDLQDTVYVFFAGGYNLDGYVLLDSNLKVKAISTWNYH